MRKKVARSLCKWADLIDPRVKPTVDNEVTVAVNCVGVDEVERRIAALRDQLVELEPALSAVNAARLPEPLQPGALYVIQAEGRLLPGQLEYLKAQLQPYTDKHGCEFMVIDGSLRIARSQEN